ncbi:MAG: ribonuclease D [Alphaproteobacteria bacterium]|nr:ribonuclease D [Alphaproteobacteria bacterium]
MREKTYYPKLCLIQLGCPDKEAAAIDPLADNLDLSPLYDLLQNEMVLKVFHAGRQDLEILFNLTGELPKPFFDTQVAAMVCGYGDQVGYEALVRDIAKAQIDKSSQFTDWSRRPLSDRQLDYALADVTHLVDVYLHLSKRLEEQGRTEWVFEEEGVLANPLTYTVNPRESWQRVKIKTPKPRALAILRELAAWRETRAQEKNIPKAWVMRDDTMAEIAHHAPQDVESLKKVRGFSADLAEHKVGKTILELVKQGAALPKDECPQPERRDPLHPALAASLEVIKMLLRIQAAEHNVAQKLIASAEELEAIVKGERDVRPLKGWRYEVFGKEADAMMAGKLAIGLQDGKIVKMKTGS